MPEQAIGAFPGNTTVLLEASESLNDAYFPLDSFVSVVLPVLPTGAAGRLRCSPI